MTEVPKIVFDRLRAARPVRPLSGVGLPERAHPDPDLLTAFAEQTLSATERDGLLDHLALCGDCREVIALALPAADIAAVLIAVETELATERAKRSSAKAARSWPTLVWPNLVWPRLVWPRLGGSTLRWAALAAGVVVVASVLLVHPGKLNQAMLPSANRLVASTATPASGAQTASSAIPRSAIPPSASPIASSPMNQPMNQSAISTRTGEARPKSGMQLSKKLKAGQIVAGRIAPPHQAQSGMMLAENKKALAQAGGLRAAPSPGAPAFDANTRSGTNESVTNETAGAPTISAAPSAEATLIARSDAPAIEKAKPALQGVEGNEPQKSETAVNLAVPALQGKNMMSAAKLSPIAGRAEHRVTWTIAGGVLRRSLDSGQSWQDALHPNHPLLCYASRNEDEDEEIWTGGQAGTLFHSADGGVTWVQVRPSIKAQQLSSDITHIDLHGSDFRGGDLRGDVRGSAEIVVSTTNKEIWSSSDGGKTWEKK